MKVGEHRLFCISCFSAVALRELYSIANVSSKTQEFTSPEFTLRLSEVAGPCNPHVLYVNG